MPDDNNPKWLLCLKDRRAAYYDEAWPIAWGESEEALRAFVAREQRTRKIAEHPTWRTFREGGPLEHYHVPTGFEDESPYVEIPHFEELKNAR
jgi:hypothetical protein